MLVFGFAADGWLSICMFSWKRKVIVCDIFETELLDCSNRFNLPGVDVLVVTWACGLRLDCHPCSINSYVGPIHMGFVSALMIPISCTGGDCDGTGGGIWDKRGRRECPEHSYRSRCSWHDWQAHRSEVNTWWGTSHMGFHWFFFTWLFHHDIGILSLQCIRLSSVLVLRVNLQGFFPCANFYVLSKGTPYASYSYILILLCIRTIINLVFSCVCGSNNAYCFVLFNSWSREPDWSYAVWGHWW